MHVNTSNTKEKIMATMAEAIEFKAELKGESVLYGYAKRDTQGPVVEIAGPWEEVKNSPLFQVILRQYENEDDDLSSYDENCPDIIYAWTEHWVLIYQEENEDEYEDLQAIPRHPLTHFSYSKDSVFA
jgi:hypothetical protein